jgi:formylglycine-generating enzyme required for sulfatase activity
VKRFVNTLSLNMVLAAESFGEGETFNIPMLVALLLIQYRREDLFRRVSQRPGLYADLTATGDDAAKLTEEYFRGDGLLQRLVQTIGCPVAADDLPRYVHLANVGGASVRDEQGLAIEPELVSIEPGTFIMGSEENDSEKPPHEVTIGYRFAIGKYPVTFAEYDAFCEATERQKPDDSGWGRERRPVINVSWDDAKAYVAWLSETAGKPYRLPTEAEWEYCCRAGTTTPYSCGDKITEKDANIDGKVGKTSEVGAYPANPWGFQDMHGNVWEWVEDVWHENYEGAPDDGGAWTEGRDQGGRVMRGGSWSIHPDLCRSADRSRDLIGNRGRDIGFRVARSP